MKNMISSNLFYLTRRALWVLLTCFWPLASWALSPMYSYNDLVAGEGSPGHRDGAFYDAQFNGPLGLAINPDASQLYVADQGNNCIRVIDIGNANHVSTLAGDEKPGFKDGPFSAARFRQPSTLVYLPSGKIVINDSGNHCFRLVDLTTKKVSTLAAYGKRENQPAGLLADPMDSVWSMVYLPARNAVYFSQPMKGTLSRLDTGSGQISTVLENDPYIPRPSALAAHQDKLYVAGEFQNMVYELKAKKSFPKEDRESFNWQPCGIVHGAQGMAYSGKNLYALQFSPQNPLIRVFPATQSVTFVTVWGDQVSHPIASPYFPDSMALTPIQLVADPLAEKKLYVPQPSLNFVSSIRELWVSATKDSTQYAPNGLVDYDYPETKPPKTYRILMVGDSHTFFILKDPSEKEEHPYNRMLTLPKRLELVLNTMAALNDASTHYEVLLAGRLSWDPLNLWPYYSVPSLVQKFNIDLVLYLPAADYTQFAWGAYFERPLTGLGIPAGNLDPEYSLKPWKERIPTGTPKKLFNLCKAQKLITFATNGHFQFVDEHEMMKDSAIRNCMVELYCKPIKLLKLRLETLKNSQGRPVRFEMGLLPSLTLTPSESENLFWKEVQAKTGIPTIDFTHHVKALAESFSTFAESDGNGHYTPDQHLFLSLVLASELIHQKIIPFTPSAGK